MYNFITNPGPKKQIKRNDARVPNITQIFFLFFYDLALLRLIFPLFFY
jgi:hypothetical protein